MKILYHHRISSKDGQAVHMDELIAAFRTLGHDVLVVGPKSFASASFGHDPTFVNLLKRRIPRFAYELLELGYNGLAFLRLRRAYRAFHPDFLYERHNLYTLAGVWLSGLYRLPRLLEINAPLAAERAANDGLAFPALARVLENWSWSSAAFALPVTQVMATQYLERGGARPERIRIIPNAINPARFGAAPAPDAAKASLNLSGKLVIGFTGFVRDWHGLDTAIDWVADGAPPFAHLLIVGEGPALPGLKAQAERLGVSGRVTFAGLVDREEIARHIAAFDIAIVPRCVDYCSPLKLFEYMALGKAIIAPNQANIREILVDHKSTLLFDAGDKEGLPAALGALARSPELRKSLGEEAKQIIARRKMTWSENAGRVIGLAQAAINASRANDRGQLASERR